MLPDPKDVAKGIKYIFRSKEEKQAAVEAQRDVHLRDSRNRIRAYIAHQREMIPKLRGLAKRALAIGDEARFRQIGKQIIWSENDITRWEKFGLTLEMLEARRDQVKASTDLVHMVKVVTDSMIELTGGEQLDQARKQLDQSLAQADDMNAGIDQMMEKMDGALAQGLPSDEQSLEKLRDSLGDEIVSQESAQAGANQDDGLEELRRQLTSDK